MKCSQKTLQCHASIYGPVLFATFMEFVDHPVGFRCRSFVHQCNKNMQAYVCGDNFVIKECAVNCMTSFEQLKVHMWAKSEGVLGPDPGQGDVREVVCLNRVFRRCLPMSGRPEAIEIEADVHAEPPDHGCWQQQASKARAAMLDIRYLWKKHTAFRSICMRANYLAEDRPDVRFALQRNRKADERTV